MNRSKTTRKLPHVTAPMTLGRGATRIRGGMRMEPRAQGDDYLMSAALDIGTSCSCYAFCFRVSGVEPEIRMNKNWGGQNFESCKSPTAVLTESGTKGKFLSFGFEAEKEYQTLTDGGKTTDKNLYHDFKMNLYREKQLKVDRTLVRSTSGTERPLLDVFVMTIQFLRGHMMDAIREAKASVPEDARIRWVITVPAIWSDQAKHFMRTAAKQAGLIETEQSTQLLLVTEPAAAGLFCFTQENNHFMEGPRVFEERGGALKFFEGMTYLVIDAGGGSVDFTAQKAVSGDDIQELKSSSGGDWGGREVNQNFVQLLKTALGEWFIDKFAKECPLQWYQFIAKFERAKKGVTEEKGFNLELPSMFERNYRRWDEEKTDIVDKLNSGANADLGISESNGYIIVSAKATKKLFEPVMDKIAEQARRLIQAKELRGVSFVFLVGGFSACKLLSAVVKAACPHITVLTPHEAQISIVKGAILYCNKPEILKLCAKKTYGASTCTTFDPKRHNERKRTSRGGEDLCKDVFLPFIQKDERIEYGIHGTMVAEPLSPSESHVVIDFYSVDRVVPPDEVLYTDSSGVRKIGSTDVTVHGEKKEVLIKFSFGHEILVTAGSLTGTAQAVKVTFDFDNTA